MTLKQIFSRFLKENNMYDIYLKCIQNAYWKKMVKKRATYLDSCVGTYAAHDLTDLPLKILGVYSPSQLQCREQWKRLMRKWDYFVHNNLFFDFDPDIKDVNQIKFQLFNEPPQEVKNIKKVEHYVNGIFFRTEGNRGYNFVPFTCISEINGQPVSLGYFCKRKGKCYGKTAAKSSEKETSAAK